MEARSKSGDLVEPRRPPGRAGRLIVALALVVGIAAVLVSPIMWRRDRQANAALPAATAGVGPAAPTPTTVPGILRGLAPATAELGPDFTELLLAALSPQAPGPAAPETAATGPDVTGPDVTGPLATEPGEALAAEPAAPEASAPVQAGPAPVTSTTSTTSTSSTSTSSTSTSTTTTTVPAPERQPIAPVSASQLFVGLRLTLEAELPASAEPGVAELSLQAELLDTRVLQAISLDFGDGTTLEVPIDPSACPLEAPEPYVVAGITHDYPAGSYTIIATVRTIPCSDGDPAPLSEETVEIRLLLTVS